MEPRDGTGGEPRYVVWRFLEIIQKRVREEEEMTEGGIVGRCRICLGVWSRWSESKREERVSLYSTEAPSS